MRRDLPAASARATANSAAASIANATTPMPACEKAGSPGALVSAQNSAAVRRPLPATARSAAAPTASSDARARSRNSAARQQASEQRRPQHAHAAARGVDHHQLVAGAQVDALAIDGRAAEAQQDQRDGAARDAQRVAEIELQRRRHRQAEQAEADGPRTERRAVTPERPRETEREEREQRARQARNEREA